MQRVRDVKIFTQSRETTYKFGPPSTTRNYSELQVHDNQRQGKTLEPGSKEPPSDDRLVHHRERSHHAVPGHPAHAGALRLPPLDAGVPLLPQPPARSGAEAEVRRPAHRHGSAAAV